MSVFVPSAAVTRASPSAIVSFHSILVRSVSLFTITLVGVKPGASGEFAKMSQVLLAEKRNSGCWRCLDAGRGSGEEIAAPIICVPRYFPTNSDTSLIFAFPARRDLLNPRGT